MAERVSKPLLNPLRSRIKVKQVIVSEARVLSEGRLCKVALPDGRASDTADLTNEILLSRLSEKTKILRGELAQVREHGRQQRRIQSVPTRQGGAILVY